MSQHLTEQELIEYQFKLADEDRYRSMHEHLAGCKTCSAALKQMAERFSALELLRGQMSVPEELIARTVKGVKSPETAHVARFNSWRWAVAAAAVVAIAAALIVMNQEGDKGAGSDRYASDSKSEENVWGDSPTERYVEAPDVHVEGIIDNERVVARAAPEPAAGDFGFAPEAPDAVVANGSSTATFGMVNGLTESLAIQPDAAHLAYQPGVMGAKTVADPFGEPPFAPASAIELVVLPRRDDVQLTIYNSADLTLVRETRNLTLKRGWNWLQFMWANTLIDPTSLSIEPRESADKITVEELVFPARLRELGRWLIRSEVSGQVPFEITYFTSGLGWRAFYMGTLNADETKMHLSSYVRVNNNSGEDYEKAHTRLIVGQVHLLDQIAALSRRQYAYDSPLILGKDKSSSHYRGFADFDGDGVALTNLYATAKYEYGLAEGEARRKEIRKEALSEYFLYSIEGVETIANTWGKRLMSFEAADVNVTSLYKYDEDRYGNQAVRFLSFANDEDHQLGATPLPNGNVRIYAQTGVGVEKGLTYIGGTSVKYIPINEEAELNLGAARLVKVEPVLWDLKTVNHVFDPNGNCTGSDEIRTWKITVTNTRKLEVDVEITRNFQTPYWKIAFEDAVATYEKHDVTHGRFTLTLAPESKHTFEYTLTTYQGVRQLKFAEEQAGTRP